MIDNLNKLDLNLNKLEEFDNKKFSSNNFREVNQQLGLIMCQLKSSTNVDTVKKLGADEQVFLEKILIKIEKLESKIQLKANLLNSFSKSII